MNPRRVLQVLDTAEPRGTAICSIVEKLAIGIDPARYQIEVCFLRPGELEESLRRVGIQSTCVHWTGSARDLCGAARFASLLRSADFSVIHQHTGGRLLTSMGRWLTDARIVRTLHFRANESTGVVPTHCNLPERDGLIAVSRIVADFSRDPRAVVIHPGIDVSLFSGKRREHKGIVIGTACRLEPIKGLRYLLDALARLVSEFHDIRLEIAGDGSLRPLLEREMRGLGISGYVSLIGWRKDLSSVMEGWDIFAIPSLDEGFSLAGLEAMAAGLPIVTSAVGGLAELVQNGETGWLVPAAAPAELADRLAELIRDGEKREAMGKAGRQRALQCFPVTRMVAQTIAVYDGLFSP
jgi:glycosyltransferase involved in cell wall biosynthesis